MVSGLTIQCGANRPLEFWRVVGHEVGQFAELGMAPAGLDGVEFGRIAWQPFDFDVPCARRGQSFGSRAMNLPAIPTDDQGPPPHTTESLHEGDDRVGANVLVVNL